MTATRMCVVLAVVVVAALAATPTTVFSKADADQLSKLVASAALDDTHSVYQAAVVADAVGAKLDTKAACLTLEYDADDLTQSHEAFLANKLLGCSKAVPKAVLSKAEEAVEDEENLASLAAAVGLYVGAKDKSKVDGDALQTVVSRVTDLQGKRGLWKESDEDDEESYVTAGLAWETLAIVHTYGTMEDDELLGLIEAGEGALDMLKAQEKHQPATSGQLFVADNSGSTVLETTSRAIVGFAALAHSMDLDLDITPLMISKLATFILSKKNAQTLDDAFHFVRALNALADNKIAVPVAAVLKETVLQQTKAGASGFLTLTVTDLFGKFAAPCKVIATRATRRGASSPVISNQEAFAAENTEGNTHYKLNFFSAKPEPGVYDIEYTISPTGGKFAAVPGTVRSVKVSTSATVGDLSVSIREQSVSGHGQVNDFVVKSGTTHPSEAKASDKYSITLALEVRSATTNKPIKPHQVVARVHNDKGAEAFFPFTVSAKKHSAEINLGKASLPGSGEYKLQIIVADANLLAPTVWDAVSLDLTLPAAAENTDETPYQVLKTISHIFREPEARPPQSVSSTFTTLVLAPGGVLVLALLRIGFNFSNYPSGFAGLAALGFIGCLGLLVLLYTLFWVQLSIFQTLYGLLALLPVTALLGNVTLNGIQKQRIKEKKE